MIIRVAFRWLLLCGCILVTCKQQLELPWSNYSLYAWGKSEVLVTINHPRIQAKQVKLSRIQPRPTPYFDKFHDAYLGKPAGMFQKRDEFTGGWIFQFSFLDSEDRMKTVDEDRNELNYPAGIHAIFLTKETIIPFRCELKTTEKCGFEFVVSPVDRKKNIKILATQGYVEFQEYGAAGIGQKIKGKLKASDGKYFWVEGWFDFTVQHVHNR